MQTRSSTKIQRHIRAATRAWLLFGICCVAAQPLPAQNTPLISGGLGFFNSTNLGSNAIQPVLAPVLAVPLGSHLLVEGRFDFRGFISPKNGNSGPYEGTFFKSTEYLQLDYIATPK